MAERWEERAYRPEDRDYRNRQAGERDRGDRAADEVRSWLGDDEAAQRRRMDEHRDSRGNRDWDDRGSSAVKRTWDQAKESMREVTDRDRNAGQRPAEWTHDDRPWDRSRPVPATDAGVYRDDYRTRNRGYGDSPNYDTAASYRAPQWNRPTENRHGEHFGRGPKGYRRSDERIREDVCDRLTDDARIDASDIDVQVKDGEVTLGGSVRSRDEKRFTEDLIEHISGVRDVNNHLKVKAADDVLGTARSGASVLGLTDTPPPPPTKTSK